MIAAMRDRRFDDLDRLRGGKVDRSMQQISRLDTPNLFCAAPMPSIMPSTIDG
jgi:hypothetical protein